MFNFLYSKKQAMDILAGKNAHNGLMAIITGQTASENYNYIIDCFGASIYPPRKMLDIGQALCTGPIGAATCTLPGAGWAAREPLGKLPAGSRGPMPRG